jgi:poly(3-hydroxybutyrate) depolymerase
MSMFGEPQWLSPNEICYEHPAFILRRFSAPGAQETPILVLPPQAGHSSHIVDYGPGQSFVAIACASGLPVYVVEWKSCTTDRCDETILDLVIQVSQAMIAIGQPVHLVGLCQAGWLATIYTTYFPLGVVSLSIGAAPVDFQAGGGRIQEIVHTTHQRVFENFVKMGGGLMDGKWIVCGFKLMHPYERYIGDYLTYWGDYGDSTKRERFQRFHRWYDHTQCIAGAWYLECVDKLFRRNQLVRGVFELAGQRVDLRNIRCPINLVAGDNDDITLVPQTMNLKYHVSPESAISEHIVKDCGHIGCFVGKRALSEAWGPIFARLSKSVDSNPKYIVSPRA